MATQVTTEAHTMTVTERPKDTDKKTTFDDLSEEIKALIVERVTRPSDLKRVCLVSKECQKIAVRFLYRSVALDLGSPNDSRLSAFLNPRNIGLKHIKQLRLYLAGVHDRCNQEQQAHFATRMILEFLPEDVLEEFRYGWSKTVDEDGEFGWCPWRPFSTDNLLLLYRKQRKMKWLEVIDFDRNALPELKKDKRIQGSLFQNAKKLALYPENRNTLNLSGYFVEKTADHLQELIVHCNFIGNDSSEVIESRELNDTATSPGLVTRTIFGSMLPFDQCTPFKNLRSLRLHKLSLRHCADTWCKVINFQELQYLRIYHCTGADTLLDQLCKARNLPKHLKAFELQHRDNSENEALVALDGFLCLVSGIRDLVIDIENVKALPAAAGIVRHSKTLELLNVHCAHGETHISPSMTSSYCDGDELVWDIEDFEKICTTCTDLEQLSCAWPATSLIRSHGEEWKSFERSACKLKTLVTLHITTWPSNKPSTQLLPRSVYETLLQALALRMFEMAAGTRPRSSDNSSSTSTSPSTSPTPPADDSDADADPTSEDTTSTPTPPEPANKLRLLAFGTSDKIYERQDSRHQILFLRSTSLTAEGLPRLHAAPVGWCLRQYLEPRSDVLDFVLHRSGERESRMPCRENTGPAGMGMGGGWGDEDDDV
ncbi:unnamed protein product [Zymoseptoria tritici ST99CH_3D1]|nr:unnamed protein product [Zymoseptoria tritici ST99CH_3D1]